MKKNLNVILIGVDTLRADHLGIYGYDRPTSPAIDALGKSGFLFEKCYSQAPITAPSFMSIMTSRYPSYHGIMDNIGATGKDGRMYILDESVPTLAETLKKFGYRTGAFTDGGNLYGKSGFERGFDYYSMNRGAGKHHGIIPEEEIFYWLNEYSRESFFLFLHTYAVHSPWVTPELYQKMFTDAPVANKKDLEGSSYEERFKKEQNAYANFLKEIDRNNPDSLKRLAALYDGAIKYVDDFICRLMSKLENLRLLNNTMIVFTSDHGEEFLDHGRLGHKQLYNEILHVPLVIKIPGSHRNHGGKTLVRSVDIFPTILETLEIPITIPIHGHSLISEIKSQSRQIALAEAETYGYAVQNETQKYIYPRYKDPEKDQNELYNVSLDVWEKNDLAIERPNLVKEMRDSYEKELHCLPLMRSTPKVEYLFQNP